MNETHYDAFISYRHTDIDAEIAEALHKKLEHYHIPRYIQKKYGKKSIARVFRDKEELPLSTDLSGNIINALENSDFLIVICSKAACESRWVYREIEYFLKTHGHDCILAVLADNEPEEAFPDILRFREVQAKGIDGTSYLIREEVEPLAADVRAESRRMRLKKVDKESLRLIAPMLHCTYDELKQRHKAYRRKQIAAATSIFAASLTGIGGYTIYKNFQVDKANQERLLTQSKYLASLAFNELQENQPLQALSYAVQSLPSDVITQPVPADTQFVLSKALNVYTSPEDNTISVTATYSSADGYSEASEYFADEKNKRLFIGNDQSIDIWNTDTNELEGSIFPTDSASIKVLKKDLLLPEKHLLYFATGSHIYAFDYLSNAVMWETEVPAIKNMVSTQNGLFILTATGICHLDAVTGEMTGEKTDLPSSYSMAADSIAVSTDGNRIAFDLLDDSIEVTYDSIRQNAWSIEGEWAYQEKVREQKRDVIAVLDIVSGKLDITDPAIGLVESLKFIDDNTILAISDNGLRANFVSDYSYYMEQINHANICLVNLKNGNKEWQNTVEYGAFDSEISVLETTDHKILLALANKCLLIDLSTGELLKTWEADSEIVSLYDIKDTGFRAFLRSGKLLTGDLDEDFWRTAAIFEEDALDVVFSSDRFFVRYRQNNGYSNAYLAKYEFVSDKNFCAIDEGYAQIVKTQMSDLRKEPIDTETLPTGLQNMDIHSFYITPAEEYLLLDNTGIISKYSSDGKTCKWSISCSEMNMYAPVWSMIDENRVVMISSIGGGIELDISDKTYGVAAVIENLRYYDADKDRYYIGDTLEDKISGYFPRVTISDLVTSAGEILARRESD